MGSSSGIVSQVLAGSRRAAGRGVAAAALVVVSAAGTVVAQTTLQAHPGPQNNGLTAPGSAMFFDLEATSNNLMVTELSTANSGAANVPFTVEVFVRSGSALGGPVGSGPGSSPSGWTSLGTAPGTQGPVSAGVSLPIDIPDIAVVPGQITGVALRFLDIGSRYFGTGAPPLSVFADAELTLTTGDSRSTPFLPSGSWFQSRALVGSLTYVTSPSGPVAYCTAGTTSHGCVPSISADANPSASSASTCTITVSGVEGQKSGIVFYGIDNSGFAPLPWGAGGTSFLCVKPPTQRTAAQTTGGTPAACDGQLVLDWNAFSAANPAALGAPFAAGDELYVQGWFRDPPAVKTTNLSDALEMTFVP